jgi:hypothetical protein
MNKSLLFINSVDFTSIVKNTFIFWFPHWKNMGPAYIEAYMVGVLLFNPLFLMTL